MNEAIKLAIEKGGYKPEYKDCVVYIDDFLGHQYSKFVDRRGDIEKWATAEIFADPLFWQALGKALGWDEIHAKNPENNICIKNKSGSITYFDDCDIYHAMRYMELILTGGDTEKYWQSLLSGSATSDRK